MSEQKVDQMNENNASNKRKMYHHRRDSRVKFLRQFFPTLVDRRTWRYSHEWRHPRGRATRDETSARHAWLTPYSTHQSNVVRNHL